MTTEQPNPIAVNPYEPPRANESEILANNAGLPNRGLVLWASTIVIWICSFFGSLGAVTLAVQITFAHEIGVNADQGLRVILIFLCSFAAVILWVLGFCQYRAVRHFEPVWAGRVCTTLFGLSLFQIVVCFSELVSVSTPRRRPDQLWIFLWPSATLLLSYVMYRWYRRLKTYYSRPDAAKSS